MKRVILFLATNFAVMLVLGLAVNLLGVDRFLTENGLNLGMLLVFSGVIGFGGGAALGNLSSRSAMLPLVKVSAAGERGGTTPRRATADAVSRPCHLE